MNTPALSVDNSPTASFCSMGSPPAQFTSSLSALYTSYPQPLSLSQDLIQRAALDVIDILSIHCKHLGGAHNAQLVYESAWVAAMSIDCDRNTQIGYYYEIHQQVNRLLLLPRLPRCHRVNTPDSLPPSQPQLLQRHVSTTKDQRIVCPDCLRSFSRPDSLIRHRRRSCTYPKDTEKPRTSSRHIKHVFSIRPY
ncbi:hypothetical protein BX666DRAFT_1938834 [Dichotomocladium elegans]|nr:hypothetical protein BX666DRAFT_1938834 [Dichotomocladium elegans]